MEPTVPTAVGAAPPTDASPTQPAHADPMGFLITRGLYGGYLLGNGLWSLPLSSPRARLEMARKKRAKPPTKCNTKQNMFS